MKNKKILSIIVICLIVVFTTTPLTVFAEQDDNVGLYDVIIEDNAELLSDEEEVNLREKMLPISQYGNVAFITTSEKNYSTEDFTKAYFRNHFGTSSGTVFAIDMYNREIYIFNDGKIYSKVNSAKAYEITDRAYTYATDKDYYMCAVTVFEQELIFIEGGSIISAMRIITGLLFGVCLSFTISICIVYFSRKPKLVTETALAPTANLNIKREYKLTKRTKTRHSSGGSGGGGSSGGGGGGGGGGSSGGGGGHSF